MLLKFLNKILNKRKWNSIIDKKTHSITFDNIGFNNKKRININQSEITKWLRNGHLQEYIYQKDIHKKGLEFFFSSYLLDITSSDVLLDAAGGRSNYLKAVRFNSNLEILYLTDHIYDGVKQLDDGIKICGGDISAIHLDNESIDKIACHHAFEHFQEEKDIAFIKESYRLLKSNGKLVIIPLFLTDKYIECWNIDIKNKFDNNAELIIDKSASIPGADDDGHFARFYDNKNLITRIINPAEKLGFECQIIECEVDNKSIPNMDSNFGSIINKPTRALVLSKN
jgi:ubiquinone/menaquinone biosynthesis C-methylase UbiE